MKDSLEQCLVKGSGKLLTTDLQDSKKPYVTRGITQKPEIDYCRSINRDFYFIDTGYMGNFPSPGNPGGKKLYHRVVKNDIQHCDLISGFSDDRWESLEKSDPRLKWSGWKDYDKKILLVVPNPKACRFYGIDQQKWLDDTILEIKKQTNLPIETRIKGSRAYRNNDYTIYDAFNSGVHATVTFNSIAALESVLYGIPAFVSVPCAASPLVKSKLELKDLYKPNLDTILDHCRRLAYGQFTLEEISNGTAWKILKEKL